MVRVMDAQERAEAGACLQGDFASLDDRIIEDLQAVAGDPKAVPRGFYGYGVVRYAIRQAEQAAREKALEEAITTIIDKSCCCAEAIRALKEVV